MPNWADFFSGSAGIWKRIGIGALGMFIIIVGLIILIASDKDIQAGVSNVVAGAAAATPKAALTAIGAAAV